MKLLFRPLSVIGGFLAGMLGKRLFSAIWGWIDDQEPPDAEHRVTTWPKLLVASALRGAVFQVARAVVDRGSRQAFMSLTGSWPGEERPEPE